MVLILNELEIDNSSESTIKFGALKIVDYIKPNWQKEGLKFKFYNEGISNKLIGIWSHDFNDQILVRVNGEGTEMFIDRDTEIKNMKFLHENNVGAELFAVFKNGICYAFVPGQIVTTDSVREEMIWTTIGKNIAKLHKIKIEHSEPVLFPKLYNFIHLLPEKFKEEHEERLNIEGISKKYLEKEAKELESILSCSKSEVVLNHNDILLPNIIWNKEKKSIQFIDFEYCGANYQAYDIGNHFCEFVGVSVDLDYKNLYPDEEFQFKWLQNYLASFYNKAKEEISPSEIDTWRKLVNKFALAAHLFWSSWALVQSCNSSIDFDFCQYAIIRMREYKLRKEKFLGL